MCLSDLQVTEKLLLLLTLLDFLAMYRSLLLFLGLLLSTHMHSATYMQRNVMNDNMYGYYHYHHTQPSQEYQDYICPLVGTC